MATTTTQEQAMSTTTVIDEYTTIIDYISGPDRYAVVKNYGEINELTVFVNDDINKIKSFIYLNTGKTISTEVAA